MRLTVDSVARYLVYGLALPDNTVFYIGKGSLVRPEQHISEARGGQLSPKCAVIRHTENVLKRYVQCRVLFETQEEDHAIWAEMKAISSQPYGSLCNKNGGMPWGHVGAVTQRYENVWEAQIFQIDGFRKYEVYSQSYSTKSAAQLMTAPHYDKLIMPEFWSRSPKRARKLRSS